MSIPSRVNGGHVNWPERLSVFAKLKVWRKHIEGRKEVMRQGWRRRQELKKVTNSLGENNFGVTVMDKKKISGKVKYEGLGLNMKGKNSSSITYQRCELVQVTYSLNLGHL